MIDLHRILVPCDFSKHSQNALIYAVAFAEKFGAGYPLHIWSYPPHLLLFTWPLALMPYMPAYILYCAVGLAVYLAVASGSERRSSAQYRKPSRAIRKTDSE